MIVGGRSYPILHQLFLLNHKFCTKSYSISYVCSSNFYNLNLFFEPLDFWSVIVIPHYHKGQSSKLKDHICHHTPYLSPLTHSPFIALPLEFPTLDLVDYGWGDIKYSLDVIILHLPNGIATSLRVESNT